MTTGIPLQTSARASNLQALLLVETTAHGMEAASSRRQALTALGYATHLVALDQLPPARPTPSCLPSPQATSRLVWLREDSVDAMLHRQPGPFDLVYLQSTAIAARTLHAIRRRFPAAATLLDGQDLCRQHSIRVAALRARPDLLPHVIAHAQEDAALATAVDAVLATSAADALTLRQAIPKAAIHAVPLTLPLASTRRRSFADRRGLAFPARFDKPADLAAATWLVQSVMPLVWRQDPALECLLLGPATTALHALSGPRVTVLGQAPDLRRVLGRVRLTVAPFRDGPRAPHALASIAARTPCVMTPTAARGLGLPPQLHHLVALGAPALADRILRLHADPLHNQATARAGIAWLRATHAETPTASALAAAIGHAMPTAASA